METPAIESILLAEDSEDDIELTRRAFAKSPAASKINVVRDGAEALDYLFQRGDHADATVPSLVLLDINMPKLNGFEVLEQMKTNPDLRAIPVVILTSSTREEDIASSYASGACSYVSKPVDYAEFLTVISHFSIYWSLVARVPSLH